MQRHFLFFYALALALGAFPQQTLAQNRLWGTYYGGKGSEWPGKVIADQAGNTYVTGRTESKEGVATPGGFDKVLEGSSAAFVAKFDSSGKPVWATYYGDAYTQGNDIGVDGFGNVYVLGTANCPSKELATPGAYDSTCQGTTEMFLVKFDQQGKRSWSTYFGGSNDDYGSAISVGLTGNIYLTGSTNSPQGIVPMPSSDPSYGGAMDAVVAKFNAQGQLQWARYYGGNGSDYGSDIACKAMTPAIGEDCYIVGTTTSGTDIATTGAHDTLYAAGNSDAFLTRISSGNGARVWGTYYGGQSRDDGISVVVDSNLNAYIGGLTFSADSIATLNAFDTTYTGDGRTDLFLARFTPSGGRVVGTYYGSTNQELFDDLAIDANNNIYLMGSVETEAGLPTPVAYDTTFGGQYDVIMAKFNSVLVRLWATYYGGNNFEMGGGTTGGISVDSSNQIYLYGSTGSNDSIASPGAFKTVPEGSESFLVKFSQ